MTKKSKEDWFTVQTEKSNVQTVRKIIGSSGNDKRKVKAAATKQKTWYVFAGRFEAETTADDVRDLLEDNDMTVVDWKELKKTQKWQERFAAFRIIVDHKDKDSLVEEDIWPTGVEIRDWLFKST